MIPPSLWVVVDIPVVTGPVRGHHRSSSILRK
jgi:hypothetical protein